MQRPIAAIVLSVFLFPLSAARVVLIDSGSFWQCRVNDATNKMWVVNDIYRLTAMNKALEACKKMSQSPASCKAERDNCDAFIDGRMTSPLWQCTALDFFANPFVSDIHKQRYDAALGAKAYCREASDYPDSCYINLITCSNLNQRI